MVRPTSLLLKPLAFAALTCGLGLAAATEPIAATTQAPGPDLPPSGRSLFDELMPRDASGEARVPFPLAALLRHVARQLSADQPSGGLAVVLIPLGRSLQRHAAGDVDAFRYPRVVVAATGESPDDAPPGHTYLRDRLYIAYHEKAAALEVISYNETDGRFEFQLVRNYREGSRADVGYANRTLCLACHHNAAPIFSRQSWDETSASPAVALRMAAAGQPYYGLDWRHGIDVPDAIDAATARANLIGTAQQLWREGCALPTREAAIACRAEALRLALRYRLSGSRLPADFASALPTRMRLTEPLLARWQQRWPQGLAIPDPSLPNRQPFAGIEGGRAQPADAELTRYADIGAAFDPLALRAPLEIWRGRSPTELARFIHALSMSFSRADIGLLDHRLATARNASVRALHFDCAERTTADASRLDLDCSGADGARLLARFASRPSAKGDIDRLVMPGNEVIGALRLGTADASGAASPQPAAQRFTLSRHGATVRTAAGEALRDLVLTRAKAGTTASRTAVVLELATDLGPLDDAIAGLEQDALARHSDGLDELPLRRDAVLRPLFARLGIGLAQPAGRSMAAPRLADPIAPRATPWPADLQPFLRQCSQCHAANTAFPPGFLRGSDDLVRSNLAVCAQRMLYRLDMNRLPPGVRSKTPMPPPAAAHAVNFAQSPDLAAMRTTLETLLSARGDSATNVLRRPYATLAPCAVAVE